MSRNANSPSHSASSSNRKSPKKREKSNQQNYGEESQFSHHNEHIQSHPNGSLHANSKIIAQNNSRNRSPNNPSHQSSNRNEFDSNREMNAKGKKSRIRQQGLDLRENNAGKRVSRPSHPVSKASLLQQQMRQGVKHGQQNKNIVPQIQQFNEPYTPQEQKMKVLQANMEKLSQSIIDLKDNYNRLEKQQHLYEQLKSNSHLKSKLSQHLPSNHPALIGKYAREYHSPQAKSPKQRANQNVSQIIGKSQISKPQNHEQILKFLLQKQRQKQERHRKLQKKVEKQHQKIEEQWKQKQKEEEQYLKWRMEMIRQAGNFEEKHKKQRQFQQKGKKYIEEFKKKWDGKQRLHEKKQREFEEKVQKEKKEQRQKILSQKKQQLKPHNPADFEEHQKWFFAKKAELDHLRKAQKDQKLHKIQEKDSSMPELYRGNAHQIVSDELKQIKQKRKLPFEKAQKVKDYKQYIRQHFVPKVHKSSSAYQEANYDPHKQIAVKRYRYYKGIAYGQIAETKPIAKNAEQVRRIGDGNMEYMKKIPKKRNSTPNQFMVNSYRSPPQRKFDAQLVRNLFSDVVQANKEKKIKVTVPEDLKSQDLKMILGQLKSVDTKLQKRQKSLNSQGRVEQHREEQRQLNQSLLNNIQKKLSLLSQL